MSYLKLYEDFLQKKESDSTRQVLPVSASEDAEEESGNEECAAPPVEVTPPPKPKMEHSYTRDNARPSGESITGLAPARNILIRRPPQCPSCHTHPIDEQEQLDSHNANTPSFNEIDAKEAMNECARIAEYVDNANAVDVDWELRINKDNWSAIQKSFYSKAVGILDNDQLGRLAYAGRPNEAMQRRVVVDKSTARMRKALAMVDWDVRLIQWLHMLFLEMLPPTYMASYLDILQTLRHKLPTLMDKMLYGRPLNVCQELMAPVMKSQWEPVINVKLHQLPQAAVMVVIPPVPASGPVPKRLQQWYTYLSGMSQIVQITLPMTGGVTARTPLDQIAEQIVSMTRVKIQELRQDNPGRSIILVGFNAGAALALQVAISESVACVVCMGFAYNTLNGVRGAPDDRILDIKIPILFVIGQNSARTSAEEMESLREKMQSDTSLVVVGCADDALRVPKNKRKVEGVTQASVDTMVVDEVFEFLQRVLTNPPGPRQPNLIANVLYPKPNKAAVAAADSFGSKTNFQRKRKQDAGDQDPLPAKTKYVPQTIGRPRSRPLAPPVVKTTQILTPTQIGGLGKMVMPQQKSTDRPSSITNDELSKAMQSILCDTPVDSEVPSVSTGDASQKLLTNYELIAPSKSSPIKTSLIGQMTVGGAGGGTAKLKMIPSNKFLQLKPQSLQSQSKVYTIKPGGMLSQTSAGATIGSIVATAPNPAITGQQQIFTLKSPNGQTTQFVTAAPPSAQQKYTVVKNATGGTSLQLTTPGQALSRAPATQSAAGAGSSGGSSVDISSIIDLPILFADNEGNLTDSVASTAGSAEPAKPTLSNVVGGTGKSSSSGVGQLIISQKIIKEANPVPPKGTYIIPHQQQPQQQQQPQLQPSKPKQIVYVNRNTMKTTSIVSRAQLTGQPLPKYTKLLVTNPKAAGANIVSRAVVGGAAHSPIVTSVKQLNLQGLKSPLVTSVGGTSSATGSLVNVMKPMQQFKIISTNSPQGAQLGDKPQIRNILVKPGGLKAIPTHLKTQLLNRNLTVRKLCGFVPGTTSGIISAASSIATETTSTVTSSAAVAGTPLNTTSAIQTSPKVFTLNPINPSTVSAAAQPKTTE